MKKILIILGFLVCLTITKAENLLIYKGDTVDIEQLVSELDSVDKIVTTIKLNDGVVGGKMNLINTLNETNDNLVINLSQQNDNIKKAIKLIYVDDPILEKEYIHRLIQEYYRQIEMWDVSSFVGQKVGVLVVIKNKKKWMTGTYIGQLQGFAIIEQYPGVLRKGILKTILPK
jgi:hypothetical protein